MSLGDVLEAVAFLDLPYNILGNLNDFESR